MEAGSGIRGSNSNVQTASWGNILWRIVCRNETSCSAQLLGSQPHKPRLKSPTFTSCRVPEFAGAFPFHFLNPRPLIEFGVSCPHSNHDVSSHQHLVTNSYLDCRVFGTIQSGPP